MGSGLSDLTGDSVQNVPALSCSPEITGQGIAKMAADQSIVKRQMRIGLTTYVSAGYINKRLFASMISVTSHGNMLELCLQLVALARSDQTI